MAFAGVECERCPKMKEKTMCQYGLYSEANTKSDHYDYHPSSCSSSSKELVDHVFLSIFLTLQIGVSKNRGKIPKMYGENNGKPL